MTILNNRLTRLVLAVLAFSAAATVAAGSASHTKSQALLSVNFEPREVIKIEAGDFHFVPGQVAPIHTHAAPAIGYVAKGEIIYQLEGQKPQLLRAGDAFYEPAGPRVLRFDNASSIEEAVFIDFNLQQKNEPFIIFEKPLTEAIDRRTLPTVTIEPHALNRVDVFVSELAPMTKKQLTRQQITLAYVAQGTVTVKGGGLKTQHYQTGETFSLPFENSVVTVDNASPQEAAKVVTFYLR